MRLLDADVSPDGELEFWLTDGDAPERCAVEVDGVFHVRGDLDAAEHRLDGDDDVSNVRRVRRRPSLGAEPAEALEVSVSDPRRQVAAARRLYRAGDRHRFELYGVDVSTPFRYLVEHDLFPTCRVSRDLEPREDRWLLDYPAPGLDAAAVEVKGERRVAAASLDGDPVEGDEESVVRGLAELLRERDPDVLVADTGDLRLLMERARHLALDPGLGRAPGSSVGEERSYHSYGRTVYKPAPVRLRGRVHVDPGSSFIHREGGLAGVVELSRLSSKPLGEVAGVSPGTVISSIQVARALRDGVLVPWKKNRPEEFRSLRNLVTADRGGFIYQPRVGFHRDVTEVDFASLYPTLIATRNISPETLNCDCCGADAAPVPQLSHRVCTRRDGFLPRVLRPLIARRAAVKDRARRGVEPDRNRGRDSALKWILLTCFGYTGYRNAKFGKIECHESICAHARHVLTRTGRMAERHGFAVLHGLVDSLWLQGDGDLDGLLDAAETRFDVPLEREERYRWIVFLRRRGSRAGALNRYYGKLRDGTVKARGVELRRRDTPPLVKEFQREALGILAEADDEEEFRSRVSAARNLLTRYRDRLRTGDVEREELAVTRTVSKPLEDYRRVTDTVAALHRHRDRGDEKRPGQKVSYVVRRAGARDRSRVSLLDEDAEGYDAEYYAGLMDRALESLLGF